MITKEQVADVVNRLSQKLQRYSQSQDTRKHRVPKAHPPASPSDIAELESYFGKKLPLSYRYFLELANGWDWLAFSGPMLSSRDIQPEGKFHQDIVEWKKDTAECGSGDVLDGLVIANLGSPNNWVYLDPNKPSGEAELTVVLWDPEFTSEFKDLIEFFEGRIKLCAKGLGEA